MPTNSALALEVARLRREVAEIKKGQRYAHGGSIENAALEVKDDTGSLRAIVGQQADGTSGVNVVNGPTPPTPSAPTVEPALAALTVTWDGTFADAQAAPLDWMRCEVHVGPTAGFTPDQGTLRDTIETAQGGSVVVPLPYTEWFIKLRSRTSSGVAGAATTAVAGTPRKAEAADITAGAITADAIAVDALTGKTITGGTITGATIQTAATGERITVNEGASNAVLVYDETGRAVGELSGRGLLLEGSSGALMWLDPDATYPSLLLTNAAKTNNAFVNVVELNSGDADLGLNCGTFTGSGFSDMRWRTFFGNDFWVAERFRDTSQSTVIGGRVELRSGFGSFGYLDTRLATPSTDILFTPGNAQLRARLQHQPPASSNSGLYVETAAGHTGHMLRLFNTDAGAYRFSVDLAGNTTIGGILSAPNIRTGSVNITPVANTPTSVQITGLNLPGTVHRAFVTAQSAVPGTVTECTANNVTADGLTVWVNRTNTTSTNIWYLVIAS